MSGRAVADSLPDRAYTTVLTVLERLRRKDLVRRTTQGRVHFFRAADSREAYVAELMVDAMGAAANRGAVLARFAESVSPEEADLLSRALDALDTERPS
jgi:predicted transcriptional regulator